MTDSNEADGTHDSSGSGLSRRTAMKSVGAAGAGALVPFGVGSAAGQSSEGTIDDALDTSGGAQEVLVVFETIDDTALLEEFDLANGYHAFEALPIAYTELTGAQIEDVAGRSAVRYVEKNEELEYHNDDAREVTGAGTVQSDLGYAGESVHSVVIDSGIDGTHPDHQQNLVGHWRYVNPLSSDDGTIWLPASDADTDDNGHGTHTAGTTAGDGTASDGQYEGMAPEADLTVYSAGLSLFIVKAVAAFDHMISRKRNGETDVQVVSNSYGSSGPGDFNPDGALEVATWESFQENVLPVFSAGNSGPDTNTLNAYTKAPHVLGVAANKDDKTVTDFSSRGRKPSYDGETNYDRKKAFKNLEDYYASDGERAKEPLGIYRNGVGAPGNAVVSTMGPTDPLQGLNPDDDAFYAAISGTSMSCPGIAGIATLVIDAARQNGQGTPDSIDVLNTIEAEAEDALSSYNPWNIGTGFVDAVDSVKRAEKGQFASFGQVDLVEY